MNNSVYTSVLTVSADDVKHCKIRMFSFASSFELFPGMDSFSPADMLPFTVSLSLQLAQLSWLQPVPGICTVGSGAVVVTHTYSAGRGVLTAMSSKCGYKRSETLGYTQHINPFSSNRFSSLTRYSAGFPNTIPLCVRL